MSRESSNLLKKLYPGDDPKDGYPRNDWKRLCDWLTELHEKSKIPNDAPFVLPDHGAKSKMYSPKNSQFRLDCQKHFEVEGHGWIAIQVQENGKGRKDNGGNTSVMTTYIHKQGYKRKEMPIITCQVISRVMESQVKHAIPEMTIFVEETEAGLVLNDVQRTPHGLLEYNATQGRAAPYRIWRP